MMAEWSSAWQLLRNCRQKGFEYGRSTEAIHPLPKLRGNWTTELGILAQRGRNDKLPELC